MLRGKSTSITLVKGPAHLPTAQERFNGALDVLQKAGAPFNVISAASFSIKDAAILAEELFAAYPETDGVIASNDIAAAAVLHEALRLGKKFRRRFRSSDTTIFRRAGFCFRRFQPSASLHMRWENKQQTCCCN